MVSIPNPVQTFELCEACVAAEDLLIEALDKSNGYKRIKVQSGGGGAGRCRYRYQARWRADKGQAWAINFLAIHSFGDAWGMPMPHHERHLRFLHTDEQLA